MRDYAKVSPQFWIGETGRRLRKLGPEAQLLALYLVSGPQANMIGLYRLPVMYMANDTCLPLEGASKALQSLREAGFCEYDEEAEVVWVKEMARFQVAESLKPEDKQAAGVRNAYAEAPKCMMLKAFFDKYSAAFHLKEPREEAPSKPLASPTDAREQRAENRDIGGGGLSPLPPTSGAGEQEPQDPIDASALGKLRTALSKSGLWNVNQLMRPEIVAEIGGWLQLGATPQDVTDAIITATTDSEGNPKEPPATPRYLTKIIARLVDARLNPKPIPKPSAPRPAQKPRMPEAENFAEKDYSKGATPIDQLPDWLRPTDEELATEEAQ